MYTSIFKGGFMISFKNLNNLSAGRTLVSDDILEFHAARILLLILLCGTGDRKRKAPRIKGLTRLAKLDFFTRYPQHFQKAALHLGENIEVNLEANESAMIRYHYGPWDERYYHVLPYLEAKNLVDIVKQSNTYEFYLTEKGKQIAFNIQQKEEFEELSNEIEEVNRVFKSYSGNKLKNLIYRLFKEEISEKKLGDIIK